VKRLGNDIHKAVEPFHLTRWKPDIQESEFDGTTVNRSVTVILDYIFIEGGAGLEERCLEQESGQAEGS